MNTENRDGASVRGWPIRSYVFAAIMWVLGFVTAMAIWGPHGH